MKSQLYFAYGSNLDADDLRIYCERHGYPTDLLTRRVGVGVLPDHELVFGRYSRTRQGGVLDLWPTDGAEVHGVLFEVDELAIAMLDAKEGHPHSYARTSVKVRVGEREVDAMTYLSRPETPRLIRPSPAYATLVRRGYQAHGLPLATLDHALAKAEASHD